MTNNPTPAGRCGRALSTGQPCPDHPMPAAPAALRDRIAQTLADNDGWEAWADEADRSTSLTWHRYLRAADAVLAVLPAPAAEAEQLLALATVLEIPRPGTASPFQLRRSHGHADRWAICDRTGRRWDREHGWVYEAESVRDESERDSTRYTLAEAVSLARKLAADEAKQAAPAPAAEEREPVCDCHGAWHFQRQHCVDWPCPDCTSICAAGQAANRTAELQEQPPDGG